MNSFTLCPSILSADFARLREQIQEVEAAGADWIHVDVMDGHFVPNLTMGPFIVETIRRITQLPIDAHLMVTDPDRMIPWYAAAGATNLSVQIETCPHIYRTIQVIRDAGCRPGVVLNPGTPAEAIEEVLPLVDVVLVMTVNPGFSGQTFIPAMLSKIERVSRLIEKTNSQAQIQVDGGIDASNLSACYQAGARLFVAATAIFKFPAGIRAGVNALREQVA